MPATARWDLPYPASTDPPAGHSQIQALAESLDDVAMDDQGLLSARPTSSPGTPGKAGRYYYATDNGKLYRDNGTGWTEVVVGGDSRLSDQRVPTNGSVSSDKMGQLHQIKLYNMATAGIAASTLTRVPLAGNSYQIPAAGVSGENQVYGFNTGLVCRHPGLYRGKAVLTWTSNATGARWAYVYKNATYGGDPDVPTGGTAIDFDVQFAFGQNRQHVVFEHRFAEGDYIQLIGYHTASVPISALPGEYTTFLQWSLVSA